MHVEVQTSSFFKRENMFSFFQNIYDSFSSDEITIEYTLTGGLGAGHGKLTCIPKDIAAAYAQIEGAVSFREKYKETAPYQILIQINGKIENETIDKSFNDLSAFKYFLEEKNLMQKNLLQKNHLTLC